jgi:hypothetical protein
MHARSVGMWPPALVGAWPPAAIVGTRGYPGGYPGYAHLVGQQAALAAVAPQYDMQPLIGSVPGGNPAGPAVVANGGPSTIGQYPIGFGPQLISKSGANTNVVSRNQVQYFQPTRFTVIDSLASPAANFSINDLKNGQKSQLINSNPIPAAAFIQTATDTLVSFTTAVAGQDLVVEVSNLDPAADHTFQAMYTGRAVGV